MNGVVCE